MGTEVTATAAAVVGIVYDDLMAWCRARGGTCRLTQNPFDMFEILQQRPDGWRLVLHWEGDRPADERVRGGGAVIHSIRLVVDGHVGPTLAPRIGLVKPAAGRSQPFLDLLDAVRQRVLSYRFDWLREPLSRPWYRGTDDKVPLPQGLFLAAYNLRFDLYSVMPMPADADVVALRT